MKTTFIAFIEQAGSMVGGYLYLRHNSNFYRISRAVGEDKPTVMEFCSMQRLQEDVRAMRSVPGLIYIDALEATPITQYTLNSIGVMIETERHRLVFERVA